MGHPLQIDTKEEQLHVPSEHASGRGRGGGREREEEGEGTAAKASNLKTLPDSQISDPHLPQDEQRRNTDPAPAPAPPHRNHTGR